ncbi:hypothetical protein CEP54_014273 [Fusarium duplospermum]|uniref:Uncharacterized protein n=1 Tax=Fusarium duplospermum TaxID=1325734 RepID=A0A428NXH8_9HYPO|nr:hypothetical protein CEP54_014273 [Fusarium duplospermum]
MTTNTDYTFTPHPSPEEIKDRWNVSLDGLEYESENQAVVAHLRSIWRENWWKYPDNIKRSFLSAARKTATTKSNIDSPSNHPLYRGPVTYDRHDFDWGVWLVLRAIYYDANKDAVSRRTQMTRSNFSRGPARKIIMQRYRGVDVLEANVPPTFPPQSRSWDKTSGNGPVVSRASPKIEIGTASASNQSSTSEGDGVQDSGPSTEAAISTTVSTTSDDSLAQSSNQAQASLNALVQSPANEGGHHCEKAADTSNDSNGRSDDSKGTPKSLNKRSLPDDEEESSPCSEHHIQKRPCTSSDQGHSTEAESIPNIGTQKAVFVEGLDHIHEVLKKHLNEKVGECVGYHVAQQTENLQPQLRDEIAQFLPEKIFGIAEGSGISRIVKQVIEGMAEQMASKMVRQVMQQTTQRLTKELTSELQLEVDKQMADRIVQNMLDKLFGSIEIPKL